MPFRIALVVILAGALLLAGCKVSTRPQTLLVHSPGSAETVRNAPHRGEYRLYALAEPPAQKAGPGQRELLLSSLLKKRERVGFSRDADGRLIAIAGGGPPELLEEGRTYLWEMIPAPGQHDNRRTAQLVGGIILVTVVAIVILGVIAVQEFENDLEDAFGNRGFYWY